MYFIFEFFAKILNRESTATIFISFPLHLGVENSFTNPITRLKFYQKYYQILLHRKFPMKERKLILVGPADSGKTSWFSPFEGNYVIMFSECKYAGFLILKVIMLLCLVHVNIFLL